MNKITAITGFRQEGKTTELGNIFIDMDVVEGKHKVFIRCVPNVNDVEIDELRNRVFGETQVNDNAFFVRVDDEEDLLNAVKERVKNANVMFFIDDPEIIFEDFFHVILELSNSYPNKECEYSFDVVYTTSGKC